jgi:hypothetical protein
VIYRCFCLMKGWICIYRGQPEYGAVGIELMECESRSKVVWMLPYLQSRMVQSLNLRVGDKTKLIYHLYFWGLIKLNMPRTLIWKAGRRNNFFFVFFLLIILYDFWKCYSLISYIYIHISCWHLSFGYIVDFELKLIYS